MYTFRMKILAISYAAILVIAAVAQLFLFEEFIDWVAALGLPGGATGAHLVTSGLVTLEVLALPFLLGMDVHVVLKRIGKVCCVLAPLAWLFVAVWLLFVKG